MVPSTIMVLTWSALDVGVSDEALGAPADGAVLLHVAEGVGRARVVQDAGAHAALVAARQGRAALGVARTLGGWHLGLGGT